MLARRTAWRRRSQKPWRDRCRPARLTNRYGLKRPFRSCRPRRLQVVEQPLPRDAADRHRALLVALADHGQVPGFEIHLAHLQRDDLRDPQAGGVQQLDHRAVALASALSSWAASNCVHLVRAERARQPLPEARQVNVARRIDGEDLLAQQEREEAAQRREHARACAHRQPALLQTFEEADDIARLDVGGAADAPALQVIERTRPGRGCRR